MIHWCVQAWTGSCSPLQAWVHSERDTLISTVRCRPMRLPTPILKNRRNQRDVECSLSFRHQNHASPSDRRLVLVVHACQVEYIWIKQNISNRILSRMYMNSSIHTADHRPWKPSHLRVETLKVMQAGSRCTHVRGGLLCSLVGRARSTSACLGSVLPIRHACKRIRIEARTAKALCLKNLVLRIGVQCLTEDTGPSRSRVCAADGMHA